MSLPGLLARSLKLPIAVSLLGMLVAYAVRDWDTMIFAVSWTVLIACAAVFLTVRSLHRQLTAERLLELLRTRTGTIVACMMMLIDLVIFGIGTGIGSAFIVLIALSALLYEWQAKDPKPGVEAGIMRGFLLGNIAVLGLLIAAGPPFLVLYLGALAS